MANTVQAKKRIRVNEKRRQLISPMRARARTLIKKLEKSMDNGNHDEASGIYKEVCQTLDRLARKNIIHKNRAARLKSRLNKRLRTMSA